MNKNIHILSRAVIIKDNKILLCKTVDMEYNFYFLPGGHVENGESVEVCLLRELKEEIGKSCYIKRFLGCLEYSFDPGYSSICHNHEYNFIFEVDSKGLSLDIVSLEKHIELIWIPMDKLIKIDFRAEPLKDLIPKWLKLPVNDSFKSEML